MTGCVRCRTPDWICPSSGRASTSTKHRQLPHPVDQVIQVNPANRHRRTGHPPPPAPPASPQPGAQRTAATRRTAPPSRLSGPPKSPAVGDADQPAQPQPDIGSLPRVLGRTGPGPAASFLCSGCGQVFLCDRKPLPHNLGQRPERHPVPVGRAAAPVPPHLHHQAIEVLLALLLSRDLPTPADPDTSTSRGTRRSAAAWNSSRIIRSSTSRPISGASSPSTRWVPPTPDSTRVARHNSCGSALPFSLGARQRRLTRSRSPPGVAWPHRRAPPPAGAAAGTWAAAFTASPATVLSPTAPRVTATSPVTTPACAARPGAAGLDPQFTDLRHQVQPWRAPPAPRPPPRPPKFPIPPLPRPR